MEDHAKNNESTMKEMAALAKQYSKWIEDEMKNFLSNFNFIRQNFPNK